VKIEQLIVQHLYNSKNVTLQGIGTLHLNPSVVLPAEADKDAIVPENAFWFEYNLKAGEDEALINFIVQQTRKIKPLASSDLESYSILAKQFLNIGKPLSIEGVGTIIKSQAGVYEFKQGHFVIPRIDDIARETKQQHEENISFESEAPKSNNSKTILMGLLLLIFTGIVALGLYYFFFKAKDPAPEIAEQEQVVENTVARADSMYTPPLDTASLSLKPADPAPVAKDSFNFRIVIKEYPDEAAINKAFNKLSGYGHRLQVIKADTARYQLAMPFTTPLADTLRAKDSLKRFFGGKPYVVPQ
jgi:hypothetical protein